MSIKAHRRKKASFKVFSFATYKGWSVFVAKGAAVRLRPSRRNKMAKTGLGLSKILGIVEGSEEIFPRKKSLDALVLIL